MPDGNVTTEIRISELPIATQANGDDQLEANQQGVTRSITVGQIAGQAAINLDLALYAKIDSPAFTGNPTAPTPAPNDNDNSIATTAFVQAALLPLGHSFPSRLVTAGPTVAMTLADVEVVINQPTGAAIAVTLPSGAPFGQLARISDGKGDANTNNITVNPPAAGTINGSATPSVLNTAWQSRQFRSMSANNWSVI